MKYLDLKLVVYAVGRWLWNVFPWFQALFTAGESKFGTDEQAFVTILGNKSAEHLRKG